MNYRHEIKHFISQADAVCIRKNLTAVASLDPHAQKDGCYRIRSLYFDDPRDTALWEKLDGVNERRKFRIRYYNGDLSYIVLECKQKRDNVGCKLQQRLTAQELERIMAGDTRWMVSSGKPLLITLYTEMKAKGLKPKCVVEYMRAPFVYDPGNVRVTIDWNIRTGPPAQFMDPKGLTVPVEGNPMLLEVKWDEFLPGIIRRATALKSRGPTAFSKYAACRIYG